MEWGYVEIGVGCCWLSLILMGVIFRGVGFILDIFCMVVGVEWGLIVDWCRCIVGKSDWNCVIV